MKEISICTKPCHINAPQTPDEGILFIDHSTNGHTGHLGHALVEYEPGKILAFYPHCFGRNYGHSGDGWMEYKRSEDGGQTWGKPAVLEYSQQAYQAASLGHSVMCEKAVCTQDGDILLFCLESTNREYFWEPLSVPTFLRSSDKGYTWSEAQQVGKERGRFNDVIYHNGVIYALIFCNDCENIFHGNSPEHHYELHISENQGKTFSLKSILSVNAIQRAYGTMTFLSENELIVYVYNNLDEYRPEYLISRDAGGTWEEPKSTFLAKKIRNPQVTAFKDGFVMHGRSGEHGDENNKGHFVLYLSDDGINWDSGRYLQMRTTGLGAYSNNLIVHDPSGGTEKLLIQASHAYRNDLTNIYHWWLT